MSLSDLASLGSFVSGLAVLASLVFLFFQMRQMTEQVRQAEKNQQAVIRQGRVNALIELNLFLAEADADVTAAFGRSTRGEAQNFEDLARYLSYSRALFQHLAENFDQFREGLLTENDFEAFGRSSAMIFPSAPVRLAWRQYKSMFNDDFVRFMDEKFAATPVVKFDSAGVVAQWNADLKAEAAKAL